jgi:hypothetical protein
VPSGVYVPARAEDLSLSFASGVDSAAQGSVLYRNGASRYAALAPGTSGQVFITGGAGANPAWGQLAHSSLSGLTTGDPHTQYALLTPDSSARNVLKPTGSFPPLTLEPFTDSSQIIARVNTLTPLTGDFNWGIAPANNAASSRRNCVLTWGYNQDPSGGGFDLAGEHSVCHRIESFFAPTVGNEWIECHLQYNNPDGFSCRPYGYTIDRNTNNVAADFQVSSFNLSNPANDVTYFTSSPVMFSHTLGLTVNTNNTPAITQRNAAGNALIPLITLSSSDVILFGSGTSSATVQGNFSVGGTLTASTTLAVGSAPHTHTFNVRGASSASFVTVANFEAGSNVDPGGTIVEIGPASNSFGGRIYGGRWASADRGMRLVGQDASGNENAEVRLNAQTPNVALVTNNTVRLQADNQGNVALGTAALATSATNGFLHLTSMAGTPSGVPTAFTGRVPLVYDTGANRLWAYNGGWRPVSDAFVRDAATNSVSTVHTMAHNTSGTPAAGFGSRQLWCLESNTTEDRDALYHDVTWATPTDASRKARSTWAVLDTAARECLRMEADGSNPMLGFLGAAAVTRRTLGAAATDLASVITLANNIRQALIDLGLCQN